MLQVIQSLKDGTIETIEVSAPKLLQGHLLIQTSASLISGGTERMLLEFGKASFIKKATLQPEKVRQVYQKLRTQGIRATLASVDSKLSHPIPLGYCNTGIVIGVGSEVDGFKVGDRVVSNGPHAQIICVPKNLCAKISAAPSVISDQEACFTVLGAIALQGIRLLNPTLGETVVVMGLGPIGLLAVQILRANGCQVIAMDLDASKLLLAQSFGAHSFNLQTEGDPVSFALNMTQGRGVDGVILAAATQSSEPTHQAANMSRKRGKIVLVGVTGLTLNRADFYEKELSFQVSCSYGPGRYDVNYEQRGMDYPISLVRWTEQRNFEAILTLLQERRINVTGLISRSFPVTEATRAYEALESDRSLLGILLDYSKIGVPEKLLSMKIVRNSPPIRAIPNFPQIGIIGAGNFCRSILLPHLNKLNASILAIASEKGLNAALAARKFQIPIHCTTAETIFQNNDINAVFIASRHESHAKLLLAGLNAGKNIYIEKPLALTIKDLQEIENTYRELSLAGKAPLICVGFNRRFSPVSRLTKTLLKQMHGPKSAILTINAGSLPLTHWENDPHIGGGRLIGEACHFIDLIRFLFDQPIIHLEVQRIPGQVGNVTLNLTFFDGSIASIHYFVNGHRSFPKERIEIFAADKIITIDDFKQVRANGFKSFSSKRFFPQNKGHREAFSVFLDAIERGDQAPIPFDQIIEVSKYAIWAQGEEIPHLEAATNKLAG